jgi:hypothetical protein
MKTIDILKDADLLAEYKLTKNFVDRHSREMGGRGRPRRFIRENVEAFLKAFHEAPKIDAWAMATADAKDRKAVDAACRPMVGPGEVGEIFGRGRSGKRGKSLPAESKKGAAA